MTATRIVIFAKAPVPGTVKTRLIPLLGADGAARFAAAMLAATVAQAAAAGLGEPELCVTPDSGDPAWRGFLPSGVRVTDQGPGDLGQRLATAARRVIGAGERILLIGTDCPDLDQARLATAARRLATHDAVLMPAEDGGYVLLGLAQFDASLFRGIAWGSATVAQATMRRIAALGWSLVVGATLRDVDEPRDLPRPAPAQSGRCAER